MRSRTLQNHALRLDDRCAGKLLQSHIPAMRCLNVANALLSLALAICTMSFRSCVTSSVSPGGLSLEIDGDVAFNRC